MTAHNNGPVITTLKIRQDIRIPCVVVKLIMYQTKQCSFSFLIIVLTDALSNVLRPTPIAKTGSPWKGWKADKNKN